MEGESTVQAILRADQVRWRLLGLVEALGLPDCWIGAGFVRNAVWDHLHHKPNSPIAGDVDVIWFDRDRADPEEDRRHEARLYQADPLIAWSVKNQARMHIRNGDSPYASAVDAMRYWPETATAIAARRSSQDHCEIGAPLGVEDLLNLRLRPTKQFIEKKRSIFNQRIQDKRWTDTWPKLKVT